jgi:membrane protease YdiL (CAAX protease family)
VGTGLASCDHAGVADRAVDRDRRTGPFFVAAFGITWVLQLPALLVTLGLVAGPIERFMLPLGLGAFGPLLAAVLISRITSGTEGLRALFRPLRTWRVGAGWYVVALLLPGAIFVAGAAVYELVGRGDAGPWFYPPLGAERIAAMICFSFGEEIGWRGYALPRLQARYGGLRASLILGVVWGVWHLPMLLIAGLAARPMVVVVLLFMPAGSVVFTWLFNRTRGSLLLAVLLHMGAHVNNSHQALPANVVPVYIHTAAYCVVALALVLLDRQSWPRPGGETPV